MANDAPVAKEATKPDGKWNYAGPVPAPLISNLPIDLEEPRLGTLGQKWPANQLPEKYIEYVMATNDKARNWWKKV
jgi:hypothetical protein